MKRIYQILILVLLAVKTFASPTDSLQMANQLYADKNFEKAQSLYEKIVSQGYESAALYYNLGNTYFKSGMYPNAILNYERALLLEPNNNDILFNLKMANQFVIDKLEPLPVPFFIKWFENTANLLSETQWAIASIVCFVCMLIFALFYLFSKTLSLKKTGFILAVIFIILSSLSGVFANHKYKQNSYRNHAIVFKPSVTVKSSPDESGTNLFVAHEGLKIEIIQQVNNWVEIKLVDGNIGWIKTDAIEII